SSAEICNSEPLLFNRTRWVVLLAKITTRRSDFRNCARSTVNLLGLICGMTASSSGSRSSTNRHIQLIFPHWKHAFVLLYSITTLLSSLGIEDFNKFRAFLGRIMEAVFSAPMSVLR